MATFFLKFNGLKLIILDRTRFRDLERDPWKQDYISANNSLYTRTSPDRKCQNLLLTEVPSPLQIFAALLLMWIHMTCKYNVSNWGHYSTTLTTSLMLVLK